MSRGLVLAARMAFRGLVRAPGTTVLAVLVLTLGLAAPVTFFSLLTGAVRPLPVPDGDRVVRVDVTQPLTGGGATDVTLRDLDLLRGSGSLKALGAFRTEGGVLLAPGVGATRVSSALLTTEVLSLLGVSPALGRAPAGDEVETGILLGFDLWQDVFDGDPGVLGRPAELGGRGRVITGVLPEGFGFPFKQNVWGILPEARGDDGPVELVGRLADGASAETATIELAGRWARGEEWREDDRRGANLKVRGFTGGRGERGEGMAYLGLVLIALALLLIACANVANLLLVRATERVRSLGVQAALGAGRIQLSAQLFLEALMLAVIGGIAGLFVAWVGVGAIEKGLAEEHFGYFWMKMAIDGRVVIFTSLLVLGAAVFAGTLPVLRILAADLHGVLKSGGSGPGVAGSGSWGRGFVSAQLALCCAALVAAALLGRSLAGSGDYGKGVPGGEILVASLDAPAEAELPAQAWGYRLAAVEEAVASVGGVRAVAVALGAPGYGEPSGGFELDGMAGERPQDLRRVTWNAVTPSYFPLFGIDLRQGRGLEAGDGVGGAPVAVVSQSFIAKHLDGGDPLGRRIRIDGADGPEPFTIVGVVEDLDLGGKASESMDRVYLSLFQLPSRGTLALVRAGDDPGALVAGVRRAVATVDPRIPLSSARTLADAYAWMTRVYRVIGGLAMAGAGAGLLVAMVGLYGLLTFMVRRRRRELGIRLALGAGGWMLAREVITLALRQLIPAAGAGLALAWIAAPVLAVVVTDGGARSPVAYLGVAVAFLTVGLFAALIPARRAAALQPAEILRGD